MLPQLINNNFPSLYEFFENNNKFDNDSYIWIKGIEIWLSMQTKSESTHRCYLKESERFLLWSVYINKKPFNALEIEDVKKYSDFITNIESIQPEWCGSRYSRDSDNWKPFVGNLSASSHDTALTILQTLFEWLVSDGRINKNPFRLLINSKKRINKQIDIANAFSKSEIKNVLDYIDNVDARTDEKMKMKMRDRWVFNLMIMTGLRCNEVTSTKFSAIKKIDNCWYLEVTGKGNKERIIPLNRKIIALMQEYRSYFGLTKYPSPNDNRTIVFSVRGLTKLNNKALYKSITTTLKKVSECVSDPHLKHKLNCASPHWLRGTFATLVNDNTDNVTLQNLMGHSSFNTTLRYINISNSKAVDAVNSINI